MLAESATSVGGRSTCSDEEAERLGIGTLVFLGAIGISCFVVPRVGGWDAKSVGVGHYITAICAACIVVASYLILAGHGGNQADLEGDEDEADNGPHAVAEGTGRARGVPEMDLAAAEGETAGLRRRSAPQHPSPDDPVWDADWANLVMQMKPDADGQKSSPKTPVEVFELNDTPTWLARMQQRRDQALRAGKQKLVQKIDKEIADVRKARALESPRGASIGVSSAVASAKGERRETKAPNSAPEEDVYGMDWSALHAEKTAENAAVPKSADVT